jgi:DNA-binding response OmpR family regulator
MNALIVDDELDISRMVAKILEKEGISATYVGSLDEARIKITSNDYDLFFLDLHLPDGIGFDLFKEIREQTDHPNVIIISAFDGDEEIKMAQELNALDFIHKPFSKQSVLEAIHKLI